MFTPSLFPKTFFSPPQKEATDKARPHKSQSAILPAATNHTKGNPRSQISCGRQPLPPQTGSTARSLRSPSQGGSFRSDTRCQNNDIPNVFFSLQAAEHGKCGISRLPAPAILFIQPLSTFAVRFFPTPVGVSSFVVSLERGMLEEIRHPFAIGSEQVLTLPSKTPDPRGAGIWRYQASGEPSGPEDADSTVAAAAALTRRRSASIRYHFRSTDPQRPEPN